ncbi:MAG: helix-turn-helix transcriptional regulator [Prevotella sp.]|nr:helix-turn-helix transcriptional regulator [Prevotella sp.]
MMCWIATPQARGEMDPDSARRELVRSDRLKDSLYNKAFGEAQAKYNAELGNDQLQEETRLVSRSRIYIIIICTVLLAAAVVLVVRQRRLIALQKQRLSEETKTLEELKLHYEHQQQDGIGNDAASELSEQDKQFLSKTMTIIDNQIESNSVNVDDIASALAMSTSQFRRRLSAITGETPQNYITNIRMQKARYLLDNTPDMTILDVAKCCGYDGQSSFTRAFKRFFGVTPSDYLAKLILTLILFTASIAVGAAPGNKSQGKQAVNRQEAMRLYEASGSYYEEQLYDSAVIVGEQALPLLRQLGMTDEVADELSILAVCTSRQSDYQKALRYAKECNAMDRASGDKEMISSSLNTIGAIYVDAKQPQEGLKYILEALQLAEEINHRARIAMYCGAAAETELSMSHFDAALRYIDQAIRLEREDGRQMKLRVRLAQKAAILLGMKQHQEALAIFDSIIPYFRHEGNRQSLAISLNKVGHTLLSMSREQGCADAEKRRLERQAVPYLREAVSLCHEMGNPYNEMHARDGLYQALWTISPDSARLELERFDLLKDSLYNNGAADLLARYNAEFGNTRLTEENTSVHRSRTIILIVCLALLAVAVTLVVMLRRRSALQRRRLSEVTMTLDELRQRYENERADRQQELSARDKDFLSRTMVIIAEQIENNSVNVDALASQMAMSTTQFRNRLKAITGETPQAYIANIRMQKARQLLDNSTPQTTILDIALSCGYEDQGAFTRAFKRFYGVTPTEYLSRN